MAEHGIATAGPGWDPHSCHHPVSGSGFHFGGYCAMLGGHFSQITKELRMKWITGLGLILISSLGWCADKLQPPDVKLGLWETTVTSQMSGLPPIPPEALARMTPEQKARMEAAMKARSGHPTTHTSRHCVTKEQLEKGATFNDERENCTR